MSSSRITITRAISTIAWPGRVGTGVWVRALWVGIEASLWSPHRLARDLVNHNPEPLAPLDTPGYDKRNAKGSRGCVSGLATTLSSGNVDYFDDDADLDFKSTS